MPELLRDKVYRQRDYADAGALPYERIPLLDAAIAWLERGLA